jgi:hypothetical protein
MQLRGGEARGSTCYYHYHATHDNSETDGAAATPSTMTTRVHHDASLHQATTTSTNPRDQVPQSTTITLPRKSEAVQATPTMQVLLPQHYVSFDTDEANDAGGMTHISVMLHRLMDRRGHGHADATHIYTNTQAWRREVKIEDDDQRSLIGGAL